MSNLPATPGFNPFEAYGAAAGSGRLNGEILKFSKGDWLLKDGSSPKHDAFYAIMDSLEVGWVKWKDNKPVERKMGRVSTGFVPPHRSELGDVDQHEWEWDSQGQPRDPWQFQNSIGLIARDDPSVVYNFTTSSRGGVGVIGDLATLYGRKIKEAPDALPIVMLGVDSYQHKNRELGRIKVPKLDVVGWARMADVQRNGALDAARAPRVEAPHGDPGPTSYDDDGESIPF